MVIDVFNKTKDVYALKLPSNNQNLMNSIYEGILSAVDQMDEDKNNVTSAVSVKYLQPYQIQLKELLNLSNSLDNTILGVDRLIMSISGNRGVLSADNFPAEKSLKDEISINNKSYRIIEYSDSSVEIILPDTYKDGDIIVATYVRNQDLPYDKQQNLYSNNQAKYTRLTNALFRSEFRSGEDYRFETKYSFDSKTLGFYEGIKLIINGNLHILTQENGKYVFTTEEEINGYSGIAFYIKDIPELFEDGVIEVLQRNIVKINTNIPDNCYGGSVRRMNDYIYSITMENLDLNKADIPQWRSSYLVEVLRCFNEIVRKPRTVDNVIKITNAMCGLPFVYEEGYISDRSYNSDKSVFVVKVTSLEGVELTYHIPEFMTDEASIKPKGSHLTKFEPLLRSPIEIMPDTTQYMENIYKGANYTLVPQGDLMDLNSSLDDFTLTEIRKNDVVVTKNDTYIVTNVQTNILTLLRADFESSKEGLGENSYRVQRIKPIDYKKVACYTENYDADNRQITLLIDDYVYKGSQIEFFIYGDSNNTKKVAVVESVTYVNGKANVVLYESLSNSFAGEVKIIATISVNGYLAYNKFIVSSNKLGLRKKGLVDHVLEQITPAKSQYEFGEVGLFSLLENPVIDFHHEKQYSEDGDTLSYYKNYADEPNYIQYQGDIVTSNLSDFWSIGFNGIDDLVNIQNYNQLNNTKGMTYILTVQDINYSKDGYLFSSREYQKNGGLSLELNQFRELNLVSDKPRECFPRIDARSFSTFVVRQLPNGYTDIWVDGIRRSSVAMQPQFEVMTLGGMLSDMLDENTGVKFSQFKLGRFLIYNNFLSETQILNVMDTILEIPEIKVEIGLEKNRGLIQTQNNAAFGKALPYMNEALFGNTIFGADDQATGRIFSNYGEESLSADIYADKYLSISNYWLGDGLLDSINSGRGGINIPRPTKHVVGFSVGLSLKFNSQNETAIFGVEGYQEWDLDFGVTLDIQNNKLLIYTDNTTVRAIPLLTSQVSIGVKSTIIFVLWNKQLYVYINGQIAGIDEISEDLPYTKEYLKVCSFGDKKHNNINMYKAMFFDKKITSGQAIALHNELVG